MLKGKVGESSPVVCFDKVIVCTKTGIVLDSGYGEWGFEMGVRYGRADRRFAGCYKRSFLYSYRERYAFLFWERTVDKS